MYLPSDERDLALRSFPAAAPFSHSEAKALADEVFGASPKELMTQLEGHIGKFLKTHGIMKAHQVSDPDVAEIAREDLTKDASRVLAFLDTVPEDKQPPLRTELAGALRRHADPSVGPLFHYHAEIVPARAWLNGHPKAQAAFDEAATEIQTLATMRLVMGEDYRDAERHLRAMDKASERMIDALGPNHDNLKNALTDAMSAPLNAMLEREAVMPHTQRTLLRILTDIHAEKMLRQDVAEMATESRGTLRKSLHKRVDAVMAENADAPLLQKAQLHYLNGLDGALALASAGQKNAAEEAYANALGLSRKMAGAHAPRLETFVAKVESDFNRSQIAAYRPLFSDRAVLKTVADLTASVDADAALSNRERALRHKALTAMETAVTSLRGGATVPERTDAALIYRGARQEVMRTAAENITLTRAQKESFMDFVENAEQSLSKAGTKHDGEFRTLTHLTFFTAREMPRPEIVEREVGRHDLGTAHRMGAKLRDTFMAVANAPSRAVSALQSAWDKATDALSQLGPLLPSGGNAAADLTPAVALVEKPTGTERLLSKLRRFGL